jgi:hypothetical protein
MWTTQSLGATTGVATPNAKACWRMSSWARRVQNLEIGSTTQIRANPQVSLKATLELDLEMNDLYLPVAELADEELQQELEALVVR